MKTNLVLDKKRITTGFLLAPFISCALATIIWIAVVIIFSDASEFSTFERVLDFIYSAITVFLSLTAIAYFITLFLGAPCLIILRRLNAVNLLSILISAYLISVLGLIAVFLIGLHDNSPSLNQILFFLLFPAHLITLLGAFIFWWIAMRPAEHQQ